MGGDSHSKSIEDHKTMGRFGTLTNLYRFNRFNSLVHKSTKSGRIPTDEQLVTIAVDCVEKAFSQTYQRKPHEHSPQQHGIIPLDAATITQFRSEFELIARYRPSLN